MCCPQGSEGEHTNIVVRSAAYRPEHDTTRHKFPGGHIHDINSILLNFNSSIMFPQFHSEFLSDDVGGLARPPWSHRTVSGGIYRLRTARRHVGTDRFWTNVFPLPRQGGGFRAVFVFRGTGGAGTMADQLAD